MRPAGILLHSCCGVCSTVALKRLVPDYHVTIFYFNPNIHPREEYERRLKWTRTLAERHGVEVVEGPYEPDLYFDAVKGLEQLGERSERCLACFAFRLKATAEKAVELGMEQFTTTLTTSRYKVSRDVMSQARKAASEADVSYIEMDFKKKGGADESVRTAKDMGMYIQNYCGCVFSMKEREARIAAKGTVRKAGG